MPAAKPELMRGTGNTRGLGIISVLAPILDTSLMRLVTAVVSIGDLVRPARL